MWKTNYEYAQARVEGGPGKWNYVFTPIFGLCKDQFKWLQRPEILPGRFHRVEEDSWHVLPPHDLLLPTVVLESASSESYYEMVEYDDEIWVWGGRLYVQVVIIVNWNGHANGSVNGQLVVCLEHVTYYTRLEWTPRNAKPRSLDQLAII